MIRWQTAQAAAVAVKLLPMMDPYRPSDARQLTAMDRGRRILAVDWTETW